MRTTLLLLTMLAAPAFGQAVYKWVDEKGVTHYSDRPMPGATKMDISTGSRWDSSTPRNSSTPAAPEPQQPSEFEAYTILGIASPQPGENIVNTGGQVTIVLGIEPQLQAGHQLGLVLDGKPVAGFAPNTTTYELKNVERGVHTAVAVVSDEQGKKLQQGTPVTFYVRQNSVAQPPVGPTLRPPPKPPKPPRN